MSDIKNCPELSNIIGSDICQRYITTLLQKVLLMQNLCLLTIQIHTKNSDTFYKKKYSKNYVKLIVIEKHTLRLSINYRENGFLPR